MTRAEWLKHEAKRLAERRIREIAQVRKFVRDHKCETIGKITFAENFAVTTNIEIPE